MGKVLEFKSKHKTGGTMEIKNQTEDKAELYFYGDIVSDWWGAWQDEDQYPDAIKDFLKEVEGKDLDIFVNSGGGSVFAGLAIYNMLKRHKGYKTVYVDGMAASIASVIALSGDKVIIPSNAFMMIHKPWFGLWGGYNADEFRKMADDLDAIEKGIMNVYKENLKEGVSIETIQELVNEETWLNGEEAAEYFNIEVGEENKAAACTSDYFNSYKNVPKEILKKPSDDNKDLEKKLDHIINKIEKLEGKKPKEEPKNEEEVKKLKQKLSFQSKRIDSFLFYQNQGGMNDE